MEATEEAEITEAITTAALATIGGATKSSNIGTFSQNVRHTQKKYKPTNRKLSF